MLTLIKIKISMFAPLLISLAGLGLSYYNEVLGSLSITIGFIYAVRRWYLMEKRNKNNDNNTDKN